MQSIKVSIPTPEPADPLAMPSGPSFVGINIPYELIHWTKTYPAIDWNEVMRHALEIQNHRNGTQGATYNTILD